MKKNYIWSYSLMALFLLFTACNTSPEDDAIPESNKVNIEPDFFEKDGSMEESVSEEEAPTEEVVGKHGYYRTYTLLKPSKLSQEKIDGMCGEATTMPLLVGSKKKKVGEVQVMNDGDNLYLTFSAKQHKYMKKVYLNIGAKGSTPFYSNGFPNLRKFNFKAFPYYFGGMKEATYVIPLSSIDVDCFEIVAYSKVYDSYNRRLYTSFAYDASLTQTYSYSYYSRCYYYNEWVRSFEYCKQSCTQESIVIKGWLYSTLSSCFSEDGFTDWGWTNAVRYSALADYQANNNANFQMPLYANKDGDQCSTEDKTQVGYIELYAFLDENNDNARSFSVKYILTDANYELTEVDFYYGSEKYPRDNDNNFTTSSEYFNYKVDGLSGSEYTIPNIVFVRGVSNGTSHFIPCAKISMKQ